MRLAWVAWALMAQPCLWRRTAGTAGSSHAELNQHMGQAMFGQACGCRTFTSPGSLYPCLNTFLSPFYAEIVLCLSVSPSLPSFKSSVCPRHHCSVCIIPKYWLFSLTIVRERTFFFFPVIFLSMPTFHHVSLPAFLYPSSSFAHLSHDVYTLLPLKLMAFTC